MPNTEIKQNHIPEAELEALIRSFKKGTFHKIGTSRALKLPKKFADCTLVKESSYLVRFGVDYENLASTMEKRDNGAEKGGLNGVVPEAEGEFVFYRNAHTGKRLVRVYPVPNVKGGRRFILNGEEVSEADLEAMGFAHSTLGVKKPKEGEGKPEQTPCLYLSLDSIVYLE